MIDQKNYSYLYSDFLKQHIHIARPLHVVADCSNGTAGMILKQLQGSKNLTLTIINELPDPNFSAHGPNPLNPGATDQLRDKVIELQADIGVIFDADADRAFFVDEKGDVLPSFIIAVLLFRHQKPPYVADETVFKSLEHLKLFDPTQLFPSRVGSYFVKQELRKVHGTVAAEFSGHYYFKDFFNTDSGIFTMIQVLNTLATGPHSFSEFYHSLPKHVLSSANITLKNQSGEDVEKIIEKHYASKPNVVIEKRDGITLDFGDMWINIRSSNTEPLLRFISGSSTQSRSLSIIKEISSLVQ